MNSEHAAHLQRMANESWIGSPERAALDAAIASLSAPQPPAEAQPVAPSAPVGVEELVERMRQAPIRLWMADLVGQKISVERMQDILTFALAQQPAAALGGVRDVLQEMRDRHVARQFKSQTLIDWADRIEAALTAALTGQQGGRSDD